MAGIVSGKVLKQLELMIELHGNGFYSFFKKLIRSVNPSINLLVSLKFEFSVTKVQILGQTGSELVLRLGFRVKVLGLRLEI